MNTAGALRKLAESFERNREAYRSGAYNETQLRREYLDPFFGLLGWDVENRRGYAEAYKDVIHEDSLKVGGSTKAPDYCFRIGGARKFFVEAKKPSVNVKEDVSPAYQLRRYAWSAKLPLSILTDFEELAVYDCRMRPSPGDKASTGRVMYLTYDQYAEKWEEIAGIFGHEAVLKGSFDKYAEGTKRKKGTAEVDEAFLGEIEGWRDELARHIALRNPGLSGRELNFAVQRTIDRIIFLRIAEDRGIEPYGQMQGLLNGTEIYGRLRTIYDRADERYNSGLFHFHPEKGRSETPDELTPGLVIDDKPLKEILRVLYYPESPYEFSVLGADILGQVYEQFLGKVIRLTEGHRAVVEDKPEVKKAGGVYYTPTYIVEYIVAHTVGKLLEGRTVKQAKGKGPRMEGSLRVLDPACGSGSFLIGAYQHLLDWHLKYYTADGPEKWAGGKYAAVCEGRGGWRLTTAERKRILTEHIFGVDIDSQAVEVTKLSLLLKVLEGESGESVSAQMRLFHERALPDLGANIKCGNSLIGPDFYTGQQMLFSEEEVYRINAFDWRAEFPEVFSYRRKTTEGTESTEKEGGFDAVIGNPPYVRIQGFPRDEIRYLGKKYRSATGNCDLYVSFIELGYSVLAPNGYLGEILPNKFFRTDYGQGLRQLLAEEQAVTKVIDFGHHQVFTATTYTCLLFLTKRHNESYQYGMSEANDVDLQKVEFVEGKTESLGAASWTFTSIQNINLIRKLQQNSKRLLDLPAQMSRGSSTGNDEVFILDSSEADIEQEILREPMFATDFQRYAFEPKGKWKIIFPYVLRNGVYELYNEKEIKTQFPKAYAYLAKHQTDLKKRKGYKEWYSYSAPRNLLLHDRAQIAVPLLAEHGAFSLIPEKYRGKFCPMASGGFTITVSNQCALKPEYVLALLNSRLLFWNLQNYSNVFRGGWITCTKQYFGELPIRIIDFSNKNDKSRYDMIVNLVDQMLELQKKAAGAKTPGEKNVLERQILATDKEIDGLVYELYGLTEEEVRIIEGVETQ